MKSRLFVLLCVSLFLALGVTAACSSGDGDSAEQSLPTATEPAPEAPAETAETTEPPPPSPTPPRASSLSVGDTGLAGLGNMLTVHAYETGVTDEFFEPDPGNEFVAIDVEGCTRNDLEEPASLNPFDFQLQMPPNTRLVADIGIKEPVLNATTLFAGDCVRGWVTFQVPQGITPQFIIFETFDADFNPVQIKWTVE